MTFMKEKENVFGYMDQQKQEKVDMLMKHIRTYTRNHKVSGGMVTKDKKKY